MYSRSYAGVKKINSKPRVEVDCGDSHVHHCEPMSQCPFISVFNGDSR